MSAEAEKPSPAPAEPPPPAGKRAAWQPCTFGGVAAFAQAPWRRLFLAQVLFALLFAADAVWFLGHCYAPVITEEIQKMPEGASLAGGQLAGIQGVQSETKFLSIAVATGEDAELDQSADLQIVLRRDHVDVSSILSSALGSLQFGYGSQAALDLSRSHLEPWWGAWRPVVLVAAGLAVAVCLLLLWAALAWIYAPAAKLSAWFCDRQLTWPGAWRLACAALLPGAALLALGLVLYGLQMTDVFGLGYFGTVHLLVGWIYVLAAPAFAPRFSSANINRNPFQS
ncbi:MAG: hypothetical protein ABSC18_03610 [Verrucomicrobiota bacterium]